MTIPELLTEFKSEGLTRDILRGWIDKDWFRGDAARGTSKQRRQFTETEVERVQTLLRCYNAGYTPEAAYRTVQAQENRSAIGWPPGISLALIGERKMKLLLEVITELAGSVFLMNRPTTLASIAKSGHQILDVESCAIFEVEGTALRLAAQASDTGINLGGVLLPIHNEARKGLTGYIAFHGKPVRLYGSALRRHSAVAGMPLGHLASGRCTSLMMLPMRDRSQVIGWLKWENRKGASGEARDSTFFDWSDQWLGEQLAQAIANVLTRVRIAEVPEKLFASLPMARSLPDFLQTLLNLVIVLTCADSGDVFWKDSERGQMILMAVHPEDGNSLRVGQVLPEPSIAHTVLRHATTENVPDVRLRADYYPGRSATLSQLSVPLFRPEGPSVGAIGVINAEAARLTAFDSSEVRAMEYLARYAAPAARVMESRDEIAQVFGRMSERAMPGEKGLYGILASVRQHLNLDEGIIFMADHKFGVLRCAATNPPRVEARKFIFGFGQTSFASIVFMEKQPRFSADPWNDPSVNKDGLKLFEIEGPLVGVPLLFGSTAVGAMVVWSKSGRTPRPDDRYALRPYADLAVTTIGIADTESRQGLLDEHIQRAQLQMQAIHFELGPVMRTILRGITLSFFDRARFFIWREGSQEFQCADSFGEDVPGKFVTTVISLTNPYANQLLEQMKAGNVQPFEVVPTETGEDPDWERLGKPKELPWCLAGMLVAGQPVGYLSADSLNSRTRANGASLTALAKAANVAAQALVLSGTIPLQAILSAPFSR